MIDQQPTSPPTEVEDLGRQNAYLQDVIAQLRAELERLRKETPGGITSPPPPDPPRRPWWRTSLLAAAILWAPLGIVLFFGIPPERWRYTAAIFASTAWFALWVYVGLSAGDPDRKKPSGPPSW